MGGEEVVRSHAGRLCRWTVGNALAGSVSDLKLIIQTMVDHPQLGATLRERWVLLLAGDDAEL